MGAYGSADQLVTHAEEIKGKVGEYLRENLEQLALSRELTTIRLDLDLEVTPADLKPAAPNRKTLHQLYSRIEARRLLATLEEGESDIAEVESPPPETHYETILEQADFDRWLARLESADCFAFDTETTSLDYMQAEIVGLSFAVKAGEAAYLPVAHIYPGAPQQLEREAVLG